jgi:tRNA wybutosine-synthesizing protein 1
MCYKHTFYGIASHRCIQMTPTLRCNQRCLFCWRSFEHEVTREEECSPGEILAGIRGLQKRALSGYKVSPYVTGDHFREALDPKHVAISLSGEPTLYAPLPELVDQLNAAGYTTFLVSNGTRPEVLERCRPFQLYVSLDAPDRETYRRICRPLGDTWDAVKDSLGLLASRRSAIRITLVAGINDANPAGFGRLIQESGARYVEVKGYMYLGYSRKRLHRESMPEHEHVQSFAREVALSSGYLIRNESRLSRVVLLERDGS